VGDCVQVQTTVAFASSVSLCLLTSDNILRNSNFTTKDFAVRTGTSSDNYVYTPQYLSNLTSSGAHYCGSLTPTSGTWFCPIMRTSGAQTAIASTGTPSCPAMDNLVYRAQLEQQCASGTATACQQLNGASPTPTPTTTPTTTPPPTPPATPTPTPSPTTTPTPTAQPQQATITQAVSFSHIDPSDYKGDLKRVYELGFGNALELYDVPNNKWHDGCGVDSVASRRAATVTFTATASPTRAAAAIAGSTSLAAAGGTAVLAGHINAAATQLGVTGVSISASDIVSIAPHTVAYTPAPTPTPTAAPSAPAASPSSSDDKTPLYIIIGVCGGVVFLVTAAVVAFAFMKPPAPEPSNKVEEPPADEDRPGVIEAVYDRPAAACGMGSAELSGFGTHAAPFSGPAADNGNMRTCC